MQLLLYSPPKVMSKKTTGLGADTVAFSAIWNHSFEIPPSISGIGLEYSAGEELGRRKLSFSGRGSDSA